MPKRLVAVKGASWKCRSEVEADASRGRKMYAPDPVTKKVPAEGGGFACGRGKRLCETVSEVPA